MPLPPMRTCCIYAANLDHRCNSPVSHLHRLFVGSAVNAAFQAYGCLFALDEAVPGTDTWHTARNNSHYADGRDQTRGRDQDWWLWCFEAGGVRDARHFCGSTGLESVKLQHVR